FRDLCPRRLSKSYRPVPEPQFPGRGPTAGALAANPNQHLPRRQHHLSMPNKFGKTRALISMLVAVGSVALLLWLGMSLLLVERRSRSPILLLILQSRDSISAELALADTL